jgi:hypothetical protein
MTMVTWVDLPQRKASQHQKKRLRELEKICLELRTENRKLWAEVKKSKAYYSHTIKFDIMSIFDWIGEEANLARIISNYSKDYFFT